MRKIKFDVMLDDIFICTLRMPYCPLFPIEEEDVRAFVISKRPTLRNKRFRIAI